VTRCNREEDLLLIRRLEFWSTQWVHIDLQRSQICEALRAAGVDPEFGGPKVGPWDSIELARLKDSLQALENGRDRILKGLGALDAVLVDTVTMEILLPGGPTEGSFLSWQPGENSFCFYRENADAARQVLPDACGEQTGATIH